MKNAFVIILFLLFAASNSFAQYNKIDSENIKIEKFDPARDASKDFQEAIDEAEKNNKRIILDVGGEWCIWCHRLDTMFIKNPDVLTFMNDNFVYLKVNYSEENKNEKFLSQFPEIPGYPHWFLLDSDGKLLLSKSSGDFEAGKGHDPKIVLEFLKEWTPKKKS
ncbi:MAG TPA: thioredoxin family protein [Ignavibacteriaceae bacterium]|nr:thioredoxin family protein [Ignavibacteriaceae bacterium]